MAIQVKGVEFADKAAGKVSTGSRTGKQSIRAAEPSQIDAGPTIKTNDAAQADRMDFA
jgi:hypothetical protein